MASMNGILSASNNFKVLQSGIVFIAILVICFLPFGDFTDKCLQNKSVYQCELDYSLLRKGTLQITSWISIWFQDSASRNTLNPSKITDTISFFITDDCKPVFHTERIP